MTVKAKKALRSKAPRAPLPSRLAAAKKFTVPTPSEQEAGVAFNVTLTAIDEYGNTRQELHGRKDARLERPGELAQRHGARIPRHGDGCHVHRRRGHGLCTQALRRPEHDAQSERRHDRRRPGPFTVKAAAAASFSVPTPTEREAGVAFNETVTAWDPGTTPRKAMRAQRRSASANPPTRPADWPPATPRRSPSPPARARPRSNCTTPRPRHSRAKEGTIEGTTGAFAVKAARPKSSPYQHPPNRKRASLST